jgi:tetrahydromethanopterin S-methyltransferase subunit F
MPTHRRITRLPGRMSVTTVRLPEGMKTDTIRQMSSAELYVLVGATMSADGVSTGFGAYVGTSAALSDGMARAGVSLHQWAVRDARLAPEAVILVSRAGRPLAEQVRLLIEASTARKISAARFTVLNVRTSAPRAGSLATRQQRLWAMHTSTQLAGLILGTVFHNHAPAAGGGTTRERLIRLVLDQQPARAWNVDDVLAAASRAGITIAGATPAQRTRRDLTTREIQGGTGRPQLSRTHLDRRAVIYPASMTLREARADYHAAHPETTVSPLRRRAKAAKFDTAPTPTT